MRQIKPLKQRGPMMLMDKVFNIGIFSSDTQNYVCTEVTDLGSDGTTKTYEVHIKWLPTTYNVPEVLRMDITLNSGNNHIVVQLFEKKENGVYLPLYHKAYDKERIASVTKMQDMIHALIKD
jgi:hypothetical protein